MSTATLNLESHETGLVERVCAGDKESFYKLIQPYEQAVFSMAMSVLGNEADAQEVSQEAVLRAFCALRHFRGECKFSTWLIQITINAALAKVRKDRRRVYESIDEQRADEKDYPDWREIPSEELQRKELSKALHRAMESLPPRYREVLVLRYVRHLSTQETARILGVTVSCVKIRLLRARSQMRDALTPAIDTSWVNGRMEFAKAHNW